MYEIEISIQRLHFSYKFELMIVDYYTTHKLICNFNEFCSSFDDYLRKESIRNMKIARFCV